MYFEVPFSPATHLANGCVCLMVLPSGISTARPELGMVPSQFSLLTVKSAGIGVEANKLKKLFDRFYQVETKSFLKQDSMGSDIGLSIVKNLVELHKGEITVESTHEEFTQFRIVFKMEKRHKNIDCGLR